MPCQAKCRGIKGRTVSFVQFTLDSRLLSRLTELGFTAPTPIQERAIPPALEGRDVLALAQKAATLSPS